MLSEPWILDADSTVKPLYGHQEGALLGYNPKKPGRPSHVYHTYTMAGLRLVLDVEVAAGNEHASQRAAPAPWALLERIPRDCSPAFLRGDSGFDTEAVMYEAEQRALPYLFKLRLTANVKKLIKKSFCKYPQCSVLLNRRLFTRSVNRRAGRIVGHAPEKARFSGGHCPIDCRI